MYSVSHLLYQGEHKLPMEGGFQACQSLNHFNTVLQINIEFCQPAIILCRSR